MPDSRYNALSYVSLDVAADIMLCGKNTVRRLLDDETYFPPDSYCYDKSSGFGGQLSFRVRRDVCEINRNHNVGYHTKGNGPFKGRTLDSFASPVEKEDTGLSLELDKAFAEFIAEPVSTVDILEDLLKKYQSDIDRISREISELQVSLNVASENKQHVLALLEAEKGV